MHPSDTGPRLDPFEEAFITDLRSFRAVVKILKERHPKLWAVHITAEAFKRIWKEAKRNDLEIHYQVSRDSYLIKLDSIHLMSNTGTLTWDAQSLHDLEKNW